ncbi:Gp49 family protein [Pantoea allii]|uniref:Gp49 family protein n=1 Tax=Pantoea allii TaxID=574096 RepID=UPI003D319080
MSEAKPVQRVTAESIENLIVGEVYFTAADGVSEREQDAEKLENYHQLALLTFCVLILRNGTTVTGEGRLPENPPEDMDPEIGVSVVCQQAREDAICKVRALESYLLKQKQYEGNQQNGN